MPDSAEQVDPAIIVVQKALLASPWCNSSTAAFGIANHAVPALRDAGLLASGDSGEAPAALTEDSEFPTLELLEAALRDRDWMRVMDVVEHMGGDPSVRRGQQ